MPFIIDFRSRILYWNYVFGILSLLLAHSLSPRFPFHLLKYDSFPGSIFLLCILNVFGLVINLALHLLGLGLGISLAADCR